MSSAKNNILGRLRSATTVGKPYESQAYTPWQSNDADTRFQRFSDCLTASHAEVILCSNDELANVINGVLEDKSVKRVATGTGGEHLETINEGIAERDHIPFEEEIGQWKHSLFENVDAGITGTVGGLAETGALVLWPSTEEPRTLSLIPPLHIAIVKKSGIVSNFPELMSKNQWNKGMPTNAVLISGPSKTADIQQTLAYGAHGPSQLVVVVLQDR
ncbi:lactate utilization protein C [Parasalinivibrio latis]|uniref:LutC/YkgG family protein n=1 Tax=Parasalinivibrio latis TaxID=2952610 RepID=UPI0030DEC12B